MLRGSEKCSKAYPTATSARTALPPLPSRIPCSAGEALDPVAMELFVGGAGFVVAAAV
jgi:hypothetical protein